MSLSLATKGIICTPAAVVGASYPVYVYVPMEEPAVATEEIGSRSIYPTIVGGKIMAELVKPVIADSKEFKPRMKADS